MNKKFVWLALLLVPLASLFLTGTSASAWQLEGSVSDIAHQFQTTNFYYPDYPPLWAVNQNAYVPIGYGIRWWFGHAKFNFRPNTYYRVELYTRNVGFNAYRDRLRTIECRLANQPIVCNSDISTTPDGYGTLSFEFFSTVATNQFNFEVGDPYYADNVPSDPNNLNFFKNEGSSSGNFYIATGKAFFNNDQVEAIQGMIGQQNQTNQKLDELNNNLNNSNSSGAQDDAGNFFSGFQTNTHGLTGIITAPLNLIQSITNQSCSSLGIPLPFVNETLNLPCMSEIYQSNFGPFLLLYQTITTGFIGYWVIVRIFALVKDFKNPDHDEVEVLDL